MKTKQEFLKQFIADIKEKADTQQIPEQKAINLFILERLADIEARLQASDFSKLFGTGSRTPLTPEDIQRIWTKNIPPPPPFESLSEMNRREKLLRFEQLMQTPSMDYDKLQEAREAHELRMKQYAERGRRDAVMEDLLGKDFTPPPLPPRDWGDEVLSRMATVGNGLKGGFFPGLFESIRHDNKDYYANIFKKGGVNTMSVATCCTEAISRVHATIQAVIDRNKIKANPFKVYINSEA